MIELLRTNDPTLIAFATALLRGEDIDCFVFDVHTSVLEGSLGVLPRRMMVAREDAFLARAVLRDNDLGHELSARRRDARRRVTGERAGTPGSPDPADPAAAPWRFDPSDLTDDALMGGRVRLWQPRRGRGYRAATDPVLLAAACPARTGETVLDLGCGAAAAALCLAARVPGAALHGLELQPAYAALAEANAVRAGAALTVHVGDLAAPPPALRALSFDHVIANPPWHGTGSTPSPDPGRDRAQREARPPADWIDAALRRLRPGGRLTLIHRAERLGAVLAALEGRAGAARVLPIAPRAGRAAGRVLVAARKGARGPLALLAPLVMHDGPAHAGDGEDFAPAARAVLRDGAPLDLEP